MPRCGSSIRHLLLLLLAAGQAQVRGLELASPQTARTAKSEIRWTFPLTEFYSTPKPFLKGNPGELTRSQAFDEYDLPPGVLAARILVSLAFGYGRRRRNL